MRMRKKPNLGVRMERCTRVLISDPEERKGKWRELLAAVEELLRLGEEAGALLPPRRSREEREVVERAKERLMARNGMTEEEAHRALRRRSMDCRIPLADAARMLLDEERPV